MKSPTKRYEKTQEAIKKYKFPQPYIITASLPFHDFVNYSYFEIDLILRHKDILYLLELKGTHVRKERHNFPLWYENAKKQEKILHKKQALIQDSLSELADQHSIFQSIEQVKTVLIKTEGLIFKGEQHIDDFLHYWLYTMRKTQHHP